MKTKLILATAALCLAKLNPSLSPLLFKTILGMVGRLGSWTDFVEYSAIAGPSLSAQMIR